MIKIEKNIISVNKVNDEFPTDIIYRSAPKRPKVLPCDIHRAKIKGEEWIIFVGLYRGKPYEIFGGSSSTIDLPKKYINGLIEKRTGKSGGIYDLIIGSGDEELKIKDIVKVFDNANHTAFTRLLSLCLRHAVSVNYTCDQLLKDKEADLFSFSKVMSRVLKKYIEDGTSTKKKCSECNFGELIYQEGCILCSSCGYSKCG